MSDNTFTRMDLAQFDGHTPGPWTVRFNGTIERRTVVKRLDGGVTRILASCGPIDAELIAAAPDLLAALRAAYAENDRLQSQLIAVQEDAMTIYGDNDRLTAEIDRLRASALTWTTVTDDRATLPKGTGAVILVLVDEEWWHQASLGANGDVRRWRLASGKWERLSVGDRWAYIPEVPHE